MKQAVILYQVPIFLKSNFNEWLLFYVFIHDIHYFKTIVHYILDEDIVDSNLMPITFNKACLKNVFTVILVLIYLLLSSVAAFLAYQTISDFMEKLNHPVMSVSYKEVEEFTPPGEFPAHWCSIVSLKICFCSVSLFVYKQELCCILGRLSYWVACIIIMTTFHLLYHRAAGRKETV